MTWPDWTNGAGNAAAVSVVIRPERESPMKTLVEVAEIGRAESGLAVVSVIRASGTIHSSVVNAGVLDHPVTGRPGLAFVTYGAVKLESLRHRPQITATFRDGWRWATVEGSAQLIGPDDPHGQVDGERLRLLLREIFVAAGGTHDNWESYDDVMASERRTAVLITPSRIYGV
jgi:PPOX class probable F420-dependent enzyme